MDTELYIHPRATNNNPPPMMMMSKKKWSIPTIKGLASLEEDEEMTESGGGGGVVGGGALEAAVLSRGRRKSWHVGKLDKLERKRRKGTVSPTPKYERQKRHSWWSIFVPEQLQSRSGRPAQESPGVPPPPSVTERRFSEIHFSQILKLRNKSKSVDHGTNPPDSVRRVGRKNREREDTDGESGSRESLAERKMQPSVPVKTTTYTVEANDTLASVAARFDTTIGELTNLNRFVSRTVFPGQVIRVPDKSGTKTGENDNDADQKSHSTSTEKSEHTDEEEMLENLRVSSPKPGHVERIGTPSSPSLEKFLKINVRHITDGQGVVSGVLLVTPNAVMFDPNVSDPLVIERGPESYGVIAPMQYVVNAAIYHDIAHMRVGSTQTRYDMPKPEVYHMKSEESEGEGEREGDTESRGEGESSCHLTTTTNQGDSNESREPSTKDTLPDLRSSTEEDDTYWSGSMQREGDAFPKAFERDLVTPTNVTSEKPSESHETTGDKSPSGEDEPSMEDAEALVKALENRRKSCLDHHWAVPSHSVDKEKEASDKEDSLPEQVEEERRGSEGHLVKLSCHDSGIDIRDPPPLPPVLPRKTVYSDADVLLGDGDFVPPIPVQPIQVNEEEKKKQSVSFSLDEEQKKDDDKQQQEKKKNKMLHRLSYPLAWVEGFTGSDEKDGSLPSSAESHPSHSSSVFSKVFSRRPSVGTFIRTQHVGQNKTGPKLDYKSMVSAEDMPELFVSVDKLIPRPARPCEDPPLYLRLRMGKPKDKKIPKNTGIMSYGKKKMRPEYWFSVPRERVDELYRFLIAWVGHLYGDLDEELVSSRGYELVDSDTELWETDDKDGGERRTSDEDITDITRESWEVLSMSGELRRALYASSAVSLDLELFLPDLVGNTEILTEDHRKQLCRHLPARAEGYVWTLMFSTSQHGFSLNSMYRKMTRLESPILMVIQDTDNNVFGALTSCALKVSDHFYGTGESLLFRFAPECQVYNWTGDNMYFIKGNNESLAIGAGDGKFGLWLDGDLNQGRTEPCSTYGNEPLTPSQDFVVKTVECWAFV